MRADGSISTVLGRLDRGSHATFDSGHRGGSITVARSRLPALAGMPEPAFVVSGVTSARAGLTADEAQADVARRRQIRDRP